MVSPTGGRVLFSSAPQGRELNSYENPAAVAAG